MAKKVERWQSDAGLIFTSEHDACKDDFASWIEKNGAPTGIGATIAKGMTKGNVDTLRIIVERMAETAPVATATFDDDVNEDRV